MYSKVQAVVQIYKIKTKIIGTKQGNLLWLRCDSEMECERRRKKVEEEWENWRENELYYNWIVTTLFMHGYLKLIKFSAHYSYSHHHLEKKQWT